MPHTPPAPTGTAAFTGTLAATRPAAPSTVTIIGGPTALIEIGGLRLLTDPTFDPPGTYPVGSRSLVKTAPAARSAAQVGRVDAVLLSHDQHPDNLDHAGRRSLASAPLVLSTRSAADRLGHPTAALEPWTAVELQRRDGGGMLTVTAVPAQHGPNGTVHLTGEVTGFVVSGQDLPVIYISGDNASLDVVDAIAASVPRIDVALLFAGGAQTPLLGDAFLTLSSEMAAHAAIALGHPRVIPLHTDGWAHFTEGMATMPAAFARLGIAELLLTAPPGSTVTL